MPRGVSQCLMVFCNLSWCFMMSNDASWCLIMSHNISSVSYYLVMSHCVSWCLMILPSIVVGSSLKSGCLRTLHAAAFTHFQHSLKTNYHLTITVSNWATTGNQCIFSFDNRDGGFAVNFQQSLTLN